MTAKPIFLLAAVSSQLFVLSANAAHHGEVSDSIIAKQRENLISNTMGKGFGPQSPRNIDSIVGKNPITFGQAPTSSSMNLCNIHFHKNAEHAGGEFTRYAGNGDGKGYQSGYTYSGNLTAKELTPVNREVCPSSHGGLKPGDTIEVHYVHSTAHVEPGPTLGACLSDANKNPQLRVEAQVFVLVNDQGAMDFNQLTRIGTQNGFQQAVNIPQNMGKPVEYSGSTTGPGYNEKGSPFQVSWSVRPKVAKLNIHSVAQWCEGNVFKEKYGHGVRNLVKNPALLSTIM
ncbi:delta-class carbonic anhydrase [Veronia pacifica]|uniref:Cadmium carbonic anhydrase n=1 Tax=Veronia pacifica TaxID=1080227 RepID=A0A1C3ER30_9GAMM|nr:delta-class carbonic anhydrase [Veronia pacifica]ODA35714.1 hypothetical protein A8L45_03660 [Veronia pacifica]